MSPLTQAVAGGRTRNVELLLEQGARVNACNREGRTALGLARAILRDRKLRADDPTYSPEDDPRHYGGVMGAALGGNPSLSPVTPVTPQACPRDDNRFYGLLVLNPPARRTPAAAS